MGRNMKDFYENNPTSGSFHRPNVTSQAGEGAIVARSGKKLVATGDSGNSQISRKVTRNKDVKKQGTRIAKVAVGESKMQKKDSGFN